MSNTPDLAPVRNAQHRTLLILMLAYGTASLLHFIHNAEFLRDYPGLPPSWTRAGIYLAWLGLTALGVFGWRTLSRGHRIAGSLVLACYALLGLDSLGHYAVAPVSAHTPTMHMTIPAEVSTATLVLVQAAKLFIEGIRGQYP
jgi:hypothetical protein